MGQQRARADEMNLVGASMGVELCVCVAELENELLSAFAHGSTLIGFSISSIELYM